MREARAVWFERAGIAALRAERIADPARGEVVVRTLFTGLSAGTERLVLAGGVPVEARASMALPSMRGSFDFPISYGYAAVGVVEEAGRDAAPPGTARVLALHPHQDRFVASAAALSPLPDGVPAPRLVLAPSVETAITIVWDAGVSLGHRCVVVGLGVVGLLVVRLAARSGAAHVTAVDRDPARLELARALGATEVHARVDDAPLERADALIEASGSPELLAPLCARAGVDARIVVASWYGARAATLPLGGLFHPHRASIRSSQVGRIPPERRDRWDHARRTELVGSLLRDDGLDALLAPPVPLAEAPSVYAELARGAVWCPPQRVFDCA